METPVSVVIPCHNQARFLAEAVDSALKQDYGNKEIIVVNDGSPDNTAEIARAFGGAIVYIEQENQGLSGARNTGIRAARGQYVAFLDSDDVYLPGALRAQASFLDAHPDFGLVVGDAVLFDESGDRGLKSLRTGRPRNPDNFRWETVEYCATPSTAMARKQVLEDVGLFYADVKRSSEDWLMWVKLSLHSNLGYLDRPLVKYRLHSSNLTRDVENINRFNRQAVDMVTRSPEFGRYPPGFRAKLLWYHVATAWRAEPKSSALRYAVRALLTDPRQIGYGMTVFRQGWANSRRRRHQASAAGATRDASDQS